MIAFFIENISLGVFTVGFNQFGRRGIKENFSLKN
jgi:cytochrome bd-type quinol oxidase subunit 1